ncbi:hypothetical protein GCM10010532_095730 [Dactylosporangium siamense]|uniref:Protein kinase domain-containing protein n=2 Tax=Dactylosporangium siamense TaxID=685454 RepID=A0A919PXW3_9ACTN|nr:hypothetical protein Dsi01nite_085790 [Dactylosporangium siamense]
MLYLSPTESVSLADAETIGSGAQGIVIGRPGDRQYCIKRFRRVSPEQDRRVDGLLRLSPVDWRGTTDYHVAWPKWPLTDQTGRIRAVGLRRIDGVSLHALFDPAQRGVAFDRPTWALNLRVALSIARLFVDLHRINVVVGDVSASNLLVERSGRVVLIDCDSVQFTDPLTGEWFAADHLTPEYAPPESLRAWAGGPLDVLPAAHDRFGLAALVCQLLMEGDHPFEGVPADAGDDGVEGNIRAGRCRLFSPERFVPIAGALTELLLPPVIRTLARRAFIDGHGDPGRRPTAAEWAAGLSEAYGSLMGCRFNRSHLYHDGFVVCVWCHRRDSGLGDHYPGGAGAEETGEPVSVAEPAESAEPAARVMPRNLTTPQVKRWRTV